MQNNNIDLKAILAYMKSVDDTDEEKSVVDPPAPPIPESVPPAFSRLGVERKRAKARSARALARARPLSSKLTKELGLVEFSSGSGLAPVASLSREKLNYEASLTSNIGGEIVYTLGTDPSIAVDWTAFTNLFERYRTLSVTVRYLPNNRYSKTTTTCVPGYVVSDWEASTALGTRNEALSQVDSCTFVSLEDPWEHKLVVPRQYPYNQWIPISASTNVAYVKAFFDGLSASVQYGRVFVTFEVELLARS